MAGVVCYLPLVYFLFEDFDIERVTKEVGVVSANSYKSLSYTLAGLWTLYPLVRRRRRSHAVALFGT